MNSPVLRIHQYSADFTEPVRFLSYVSRSPSFPSLYTRAYFDWKIAGNPFGPSAAYLRIRDDRAAAHCSITAKPPNLALIGAVRLAELGDGHTHPDFQRQGHFGAVGRHTVTECEKAAASGSLIYGLPNSKALRVWLKSGGCELEPMGVREMRLSPLRQPLHRVIGWVARGGATLERADDAAVASEAIDRVWTEAQSAGWLVGKSAAWWRWRYADATERYVTYLIRVGTVPRGWVVVKRAPSRVPLVHRLTICDVVAVASDMEAVGLALILQTVPRPLDVVTIWTQQDTPLDDAAVRLGFRPVRDVPVVFAKNATLDSVRTAGRRLRLAIGDTDNV